MKFPGKRCGIGLLVLLGAAGCDNMWHQAHYGPYDPSDHFADGASARPPPAHTVAAGPMPPPENAAGRRDGRLVAEVPEPVTRALLQRGRECFDVHCAVCHGEDGYGGGIVVRRGFPAPPSLHEPRLRAAPAGHFYEVITQGYGIMYPAGYRIEPRDRWAIVAYVRALQLSQHATLADVPVAERPRLLQP